MENTSNNADLVNQFASITGTNQERAKFYLECANWELDIALSQFYESDEVSNQDITENEEVKVIEAEKDPKKTKHSFAKPPRFATLSSLGNKPDSSSDEEGQAFYAGGSERSGQQILGPPKVKDDNKIVENMLQSAKEHGAIIVDPTMPNPAFKGKPKFLGTGYKLGNSSQEQSEAVAGASAPSKPKEVVLKLWKDGFSVDEGKLRDYHDPNNQTFLNSVSRGEIPYELLKGSNSTEVLVNMEDHRESNYQAPAQVLKPFSGEGHMLGSPTPDFLSTKPTPEESKEKLEAASQSINVDSSQPVTNIQIRLADGSRLVAQFNLTHTVADLRQYIVIARPDYGSVLFTLQTTFPNKELNNDSETIKDANLLNTIIHQKLK